MSFLKKYLLLVVLIFGLAGCDSTVPPLKFKDGIAIQKPQPVQTVAVPQPPTVTVTTKVSVSQPQATPEPQPKPAPVLASPKAIADSQPIVPVVNPNPVVPSPKIVTNSPALSVEVSETISAAPVAPKKSHLGIVIYYSIIFAAVGIYLYYTKKYKTIIKWFQSLLAKWPKNPFASKPETTAASAVPQPSPTQPVHQEPTHQVVLPQPAPVVQPLPVPSPVQAADQTKAQ